LAVIAEIFPLEGTEHFDGELLKSSLNLIRKSHVVDVSDDL